MYKKLLIAVLVIFSCSLNAQNQLNFEFDFARFHNDSSSVYLEFYYNLKTNNLPVSVNNDVNVIVNIEMQNVETKELLINKKYKIAGTNADSERKDFAGVFGFPIPAGKYNLVIKANDSTDPSFNKTINEIITILPYSNYFSSVSDIQLATNIIKDGNPNSIFFKNTFEIIPNPSMVYSNINPVLFYYAELYNLKTDTPQGNYTLIKEVYNSIGKKVVGNSKIIKNNSGSAVEVGTVNLAKLPSDTYNLVLSYVDTKTNKAFLSSKRFFLYNPDVKESADLLPVDNGVIGSEFGLYTMEECDKMFSASKYLASRKEIDQFSRLDSLHAKREFLYNFWSIRDENPATPKNEFKEEYMKRLALANKSFSRMNKEGYLTDRGRTLLLYGEPDQKDYFPSESNMKPYEVWFYNQIEGGTSFIFGDVSGFGNYELLHSTKRGELRDENWQRRLRTAVQ